MKKKSIVLVVVLVLVLMLAGCGGGSNAEIPNDTKDINEQSNNDATEKIDYDSLYQSILDRYYWNIQNNFPNGSENLGSGQQSVYEVSSYFENALDIVGYSIEDINGDNVPELIIGDVQSQGSEYPGNDIYALYAITDNTPVLAFESWSRNRYSYLGDGRFFNQGASGAVYYNFADFEVKENSAELIFNDFYFSDFDDESGSIIIYHNTKGTDDVMGSEQLDWTEEDYFDAQQELAQQTTVIELTPLSEYNFQGHGWYTTEFVADYVKNFDDTYADDIDYEYINSDQGENNVLIYMDNGDVTDFAVVSLTNFTMDEYDNFYFDFTELENIGTVKAGETVLIGEEIYGTIPNYGIIFTDKEGYQRKFAINISGYDGSLTLTSFL